MVCIFAFFAQTGFAAGSDVTVTVNGEVLNTPIPARIENERTMLPMRAIFESLGASVTWMGDEQIIFAAKDDTVLTMKIGLARMSLQRAESDENEAIELDVAPYIENDFTLVPVRAVCEGLGAKVDWIEADRTVVITTEQRNVLSEK